MTPRRPVPAVCLDLLRHFEGKNGTFEATRAQDPGGLWEIGWSHRLTGPEDPHWSAHINEATADELAMLDLNEAAAEVEFMVGSAINVMTDNHYAALIDFAYNEGPGRLQDSTLLQRVRQCRFAEVPAQLRLWVYGKVDGKEVKLPGLVRRREAEASIWRDQPWR